jgi:branched-subunit amino acid transport protein
MMEAEYFWMVVLGMGLVTYVPRWLPLVVLSGRNLPAWLKEWLDLIPSAILGSLVLPALITSDNPRALDLFRPESLAAIPAFLVALKTRSLAGTTVTGMVSYWLLGLLEIWK